VTWQFMILKIDNVVVKLQTATNNVILYKDYVTENISSKWRYKNFLFLSAFLSKILVALLGEPNGETECKWRGCFYGFYSF